MANNIARLGVLLGLDSAEFVKGIEAAGQKLEAFGKQAEIYGKIGAAALVAMSAKALQFADDIADVAQANDVTIDSILKLNNALANSGGKAEDAGKLLAGFTKFVDSAAGGSLDAQKAFAKAGVSLADLGKLGTEDLFQKAIQGIAAIEDPLTRNSKAMDIFGKAAKGVDFIGLADGMKSGADATEEQAKAIKDAADSFDILSQNTRNFVQVLTVELGPPLKLTLDYMNGLSSGTNIFGQVFKTVFQTVAVLGSNVHFIFKGISDEIFHTIESTKILATEGVAAAAKFNQAYDDRKAQERAALDLYQSKVMSESTGRGQGSVDPRIIGSEKPDTSREIKKAVNPEAEKWEKLKNKFAADRQKILDEDRQAVANYQAQIDKNIFSDYEQWEKLKNKTAADRQKMMDEDAQAAANYSAQLSKNNVAEYERQQIASQTLDRQHELFQLEVRGAYMKKEDLQLERDLLEINNRKIDQLAAIAKMELSPKDRADATQRELDNSEKSIALAKERYAINKSQREGGFFQGMERGASNFFQNLPTDLERGQQAFSAVFGNMEQAIDKFVQTGKFAFKDFAASVIRDLIAIQIKAQATSILGSVFKGLGFGGPSGAIGGGGGFGTGANYGNLDLGGFFADGGTPPVNQVSIVGERGPELFVPSTIGTIIPNNKIAEIVKGNKFDAKENYKNLNLGGFFAEGGIPPVNKASIVGERGPELFIPRTNESSVPKNSLSGMSGGGQTINYNGPFIQSMSAIDTQSGLQFLAKNKQSVWSAYQSANRGIPMSR